MELKDTKVGDQVFVYARRNRDNLISLEVCKTIKTFNLFATVLRNSSGTTDLGWKEGEEYPTGDSYFTSSQEFINQGFVKTAKYGNWCECELTNVQTNIINMTANQIINDYICPTCKNNRCSKSEKLCWRCGEKL